MYSRDRGVSGRLSDGLFLAGVLYVAVTAVVAVSFLLVRLSDRPGTNVEQVATGLEDDGLFLAIATLITAVICLGYLTLICRIRGWRTRDYLALDRLRLRPTMVCLGMLLAFAVVSDG